MKQNKKGVSDVVASVLMIMLVIVAIGIIYSFVVPFVKNSLQKSTECLSYKESYLFDESFPFNCYSSIESTYKFSVKANLDDSLAENVGGLKLVLVDQNGLTKILEIKDGASGKIKKFNHFAGFKGLHYLKDGNSIVYLTGLTEDGNLKGFEIKYESGEYVPAYKVFTQKSNPDFFK